MRSLTFGLSLLRQPTIYGATIRAWDTQIGARVSSDSLRMRRLGHIHARICAIEQESALAYVCSHRRGTLKLGARFLVAAELDEQIATNRR